MGYYAIVRGPLGVGKSTVARLVADRVGGLTISIDRILDEHGLDEWEDGFMSRRVFLEANRYAVREASGPLSQGVPVVFDGNFYWEVTIRDLLDRLPPPGYVFTLRAPVDLCIERDARRSTSYGAQATRDVYAHSTRFSLGILVDATGSPEAAADQIVAGLPSHEWTD